MATVTGVRCAECESPRDPGHAGACPKCGSNRRIVELLIQSELKPRAGLRMRQRRDGYPGFVKEVKQRRKVAGESGNEAREVQITDRSDPDKTVREHRVEELVEGEWKVVHEHRDEHPAKHRPGSGA